MKKENAIFILQNIDNYLKRQIDYSERNHDVIMMAIEALKEQRPHGEWIPFEYDEKCNPKPLPKGSPSEMEEYWAEEFMCSNCGGLHHWRNFCPKCGADMRKEEGEKEC